MTEDENHVLRPFNAAEAIRVNVAARLASVSTRTVQRWAIEKGIGLRVGGQWRISKPALYMAVEGDEKALRAFRGGDRTSERVAAYIRRAKTPPNATGSDCD